MSWNLKEVVMVPANRKTTIYFGNGNKFELLHCSINSMTPYDNPYYQFLHILSKERMKKGDWYYDEISSSVHRADPVKIDVSKLIPENGYCKVIASTDTELGLPRPADKFINDYIVGYNNGRGLKEIEVEYEFVFTSVYLGERIKVNVNNEININKTDYSFTKDELWAVLSSVMGLGMSLRQDQLNGQTNDSATYVLDKWIEKNL